MPKPNLSAYSESELKGFIKLNQKRYAVIQKELDGIRNQIDLYQDELDRRAVERYWTKHPDLRVHIGDKLLVNEAYDKWVGPSKLNDLPRWHQIGEVATAEYVYLDDNKPRNRTPVAVRCHGKGWISVIPLELAASMRAAYLVKPPTLSC